MGLFGKLLGGKQTQHRLYVDSAFSLLERLSKNLPLPEWQERVASYTVEEKEAISATCSRFQAFANSTVSAEGGAQMLFHPDLAEPIQRMLTEVALKNLGDSEWRYSRDGTFHSAMEAILKGEPTLPTHWEKKISTYLKAYLCNMNPFVFLDLAELLIRARRHQYAVMAVEVALEFPLWAGTRQPGKFETIAAQCTHNLFRDSDYSEVYADPTGFYSPESIAKLRHKAREVGALAWQVRDGAAGQS